MSPVVQRAQETTKDIYTRGKLLTSTVINEFGYSKIYSKKQHGFIGRASVPTSISSAEPLYPSPEEQYGIITARKKQFNTRMVQAYEDAIFFTARSMAGTVQAYEDVISSSARSMAEMVQAYEDVIFSASESATGIFQAYEDAIFSASRSLDEFLKSFEKLVLHGSLKPKKALEIIKGSGKFKILSSQDIFNEREIDKTMTYEKFLKRRKNSYVPIEDFIIKERYE